MQPWSYDMRTLLCLVLLTLAACAGDEPSTRGGSDTDTDTDTTDSGVTESHYAADGATLPDGWCSIDNGFLADAPDCVGGVDLDCEPCACPSGMETCPTGRWTLVPCDEDPTSYINEVAASGGC